jgi:hypothetical protein
MPSLDGETEVSVATPGLSGLQEKCKYLYPHFPYTGVSPDIEHFVQRCRADFRASPRLSCSDAASVRVIRRSPTWISAG